MMSDQPTLYRINLNPNEPDYDDMEVEYWVSDTEGRDAGWLVAVEPTEHQHQWLPWLTLPNGSSWTQCVPCGEQFQYDGPA